MPKEVRVYVSGDQPLTGSPRLIRLELALLADMIWAIAVAEAAAEHDRNPEP
jgi:hypothetical protein